MSPDMKTFLKWLAFVILLALAWFLGGHYANAQPYTFESQAKLQSSTYSAGVLTIKVTIPSTEATMIQKGMGKADAAAAVTQIGQQAADDVKRLSERMYHKQRDDARDFIPQSAIDAALQSRAAYEAEKKRLADSVAAAQTQGMILPDQDMGKPLYSAIGGGTKPHVAGWLEEPIFAGVGKASGIGKSYDPVFSQVFSQVWEEGNEPSMDHGYPESWGWIAFIVYDVPRYLFYGMVGYGVFLLAHWAAHSMVEWP